MSGPIAVAIFLAVAIGTTVFRRLAVARGWVAEANARSSHQGAIPVGAGIVVLVAALIGAWPIESLGWGYLAGALLLGAVSSVDDLYGLPIAARLAAHVLAAAAMVTGAYGPAPLQISLPLMGSVSLGALTWPLLVLWIVGLINVYNFMDGIDGLAGLQAVVAGVAWYLLGSRFAMSGVAHFGLIVAAASAGFVLHNLSKHRIFLGDVGSVFLGYSFAALTVTASFSNPGGPIFFTGALFLWPMLFDASFTLIRRWRAGQRLTEAHRDHLYQRLVKGGISHLRVSLVYAVLSVLGAGAGALLLFQSPLFDAVALVSLASLSFLLWSWVKSVELSTASDATVKSQNPVPSSSGAHE